MRSIAVVLNLYTVQLRILDTFPDKVSRWFRQGLTFELSSRLLRFIFKLAVPTGKVLRPGNACGNVAFCNYVRSEVSSVFAGFDRSIFILHAVSLRILDRLPDKVSCWFRWSFGFQFYPGLLRYILRSAFPIGSVLRPANGWGIGTLCNGVCFELPLSLFRFILKSALLNFSCPQVCFDLSSSLLRLCL